MRTGLRARSILFSFLCMALCACSDAASRYHEPAGLEISALRWRQADQLFRNDDRWFGGDGAYSIDLGAGRVLWLFGDSFIGRGYSRDRNSAVVVRNTVAVQKGYDPAHASASFYWNTVQDRPEAFFRISGPSWYWPGAGIKIENRLLIFLMEIEPADNELGFAAAGWAAVLVKNPGREPSRWKMDRIQTPQNDFGVIIGSAGALVIDGYLYVFGAHALDHGAYLVRWELCDAARGEMMHPQWWTGERGWVDQSLLMRRPQPVFRDAQMEFTVHYEKTLGRFMQVQAGSFLDGCLTYRLAGSLTGPWSEKKTLYCPGEAREANVLFYAGKAHPCLRGADLLCTYALNSLDEKRLLDSHDLYYPAFVRVMITGFQ